MGELRDEGQEQDGRMKGAAVSELGKERGQAA